MLSGVLLLLLAPCAYAAADAAAALKVFAVGDSLTAGFHVISNAVVYHPYTTRLEELCEQCETKNIGVVGMMVPAMKVHMENAFYSEANVVIILGGTNDLIRHVPGATIGAGIVEIHEAAKRLLRARGVDDPHTVAITIPDTHEARHDKERRVANKVIRHYVSANVASTLLFDMEDIWPRDREGFSDLWSKDGMHFSEVGYDRMGYELYEILKLHLMSAKEEKEE